VYAANIWSGAGALLALVLVIAAIWFDAGTPMMALALFGTPQLVWFVNYLYVFYVERPQWPHLISPLNANARGLARILDDDRPSRISWTASQSAFDIKGS